jgi:uncharacterized protein (TIGR02996 family)
MNSTPDPTRDALYAAILAHPDEDTPRLAYADHIEEQGDSARAEFIRLQCRLAAANEWDDGHTAADVRCRRLLAEHPEWHKELGFGDPNCWSGEPRFRRGFMEHTGFSPDWFRSNFESMFRKIPLRSTALRVGPNELSFEKFAASAAIGRLRRLTLYLDSDALGALANVPQLAALEKLHAWVSSVDVELLRKLVESPHLRNLRSFTFRANGHHGRPPDANWRWKWLPNLRELVLGENEQSDAYPLCILNMGGWDMPLERLSMPAGFLDAGRIVFERIGKGHLSTLIDLDLEHVQVHSYVIAPLRGLERPRLKSLRLRKLRPSRPPNTPAKPDDLFQGPWLNDLRRLDLSGAEVDDSWLASATESPFASNLRSLDLADAGFSPDAFRVAFDPSRGWPNLQRLNLKGTQCPEDVLIGLLDNPGTSNLISLTAGAGQPAPKFLKRLAKSPASARFREFDLSVRMDDATANALYRSPHLEGIDRLKVVKGIAGRTACNRLARRFGTRVMIASNR